MITIIVDYKSVEDKTISQVHFSGHAGYADIGHDIICSAVSVLLLTAINSIEEIVGINNFYRILEGSDNEVNASIFVPEDLQLGEDKSRDVQLLLRSMLIGLDAVKASYRDEENNEEYIEIIYSK